MIVHNETQGSLEWSLLRAGIPTASEFDRILTPKLEPRTGEMPKSYLAEKLAEYWLGGPLAKFNSFDMDQGKILEEEARPWASLHFDCDIQQVGFITNDAGTIGCSPDGLIGEDCGIEIKCPQPQTHVAYLLAGILPPDYACQVHGSLYVTGRASWRFLSYRRNFPPFILQVNRDEEIMERIGDALAAFNEHLESAKQKLFDLNGGPPARKRYEAQPIQQPEPELEEIGIIP